MAHDSALAAVLEPLYESILQPARLETFGQELARLTASNITAILIHGVASGSGDAALIHGTDPAEMARRLAGHDLKYDPWITRVVPQLATGRVINSEDLMPREEMGRTEAFHRYYRHLDIGQQVASVAHYDGTDSVTVSICRGVHAPLFGEDELATLRALTPHWVNAYAIHRRMGRLQRQVESLEAAVTRLPLATFLLDSRQRILRMSHAAEQLLSQGNLLRAENGRLLSANDSVVLQQLLFESSQGSTRDGARQRQQGQMILHDGKGRAAMVVSVHPLPAYLGTEGLQGQACLVSAHAVGREPGQNCKASLQALYRLTEAEGSLAVALHQHADLALAAKACGITTASAQTRMKLIYDKTGERGQAALMRLLSAIAAAS